MIETIKNIGLIVGATISVITLATIIIKPIRNKFINWIKQTTRIENTDKLIIELKDSFDEFSKDIKEDIALLKDDSELNKKANKCICSNRIINAYEKYKDADSLPSGEMDSLIEHWDIYHGELHGNGKVEYKYNILKNKPIQSG